MIHTYTAFRVQYCIHEQSKSPIVQDAFLWISGFISCTWVTSQRWRLLFSAQNADMWLCGFTCTTGRSSFVYIHCRTPLNCSLPTYLQWENPVVCRQPLHHWYPNSNHMQCPTLPWSTALLDLPLVLFHQSASSLQLHRAFQTLKRSKITIDIHFIT